MIFTSISTKISTSHDLDSGTIPTAARVPLFKSIVSIVLLAGVALAGPAFAAARPAAVPAEFLVTPFGYFHPSCINHLAQEDVLRQDEKAIQRANGAYENIQTCAYPHYKADGEKVVGDEPGATQPKISHSWVVSASSTTSSAYGTLSAEWLVPAAPSANDGQTVFLFNGLEDIHSASTTILQPVLGWNSDFASAWGIASWNCCVNGAVNESAPIKVKAGDHLLGYVISSYTCSGSSTCATWYIGIMDETSGTGSVLTTSNYGLTFDWAFGGVLEVYNVSQCDDYPNGGEIGFFNQAATNDQFAPINPSWTVNNDYSGLTPQCNYGGSLPKQVTLTY